jgi:hypothetical protein
LFTAARMRPSPFREVVGSVWLMLRGGLKPHRLVADRTADREAQAARHRLAARVGS